MNLWKWLWGSWNRVRRGGRGEYISLSMEAQDTQKILLNLYKHDSLLPKTRLSKIMKSLISKYQMNRNLSKRCHYSHIRNRQGNLIQSYCQTADWQNFYIVHKHDSPPLYLLKKYNASMKLCVVFCRIYDFIQNLCLRANITKEKNTYSLIFSFRSALEALQNNGCICSICANNNEVGTNQTINLFLGGSIKNSLLLPICHFLIHRFKVPILTPENGRVQLKYSEDNLGTLFFVDNKYLNASFLCFLKTSQMSTHGDISMELGDKGIGTIDKKLQKYNLFR